MEEKKSLLIPLDLIVMDAFAMIFIGLGAAKLFADVDIVPKFLRFDGYAIGFIVAGVMLAMPMMTHIIRMAKAARQQPPDK